MHDHTPQDSRTITVERRPQTRHQVQGQPAVGYPTARHVTDWRYTGAREYVLLTKKASHTHAYGLRRAANIHTLNASRMTGQPPKSSFSISPIVASQTRSTLRPMPSRHPLTVAPSPQRRCPPTGTPPLPQHLLTRLGTVVLRAHPRTRLLSVWAGEDRGASHGGYRVGMTAIATVWRSLRSRMTSR